MFHVLDQITVPLSLGYMSKIWAKSSVTYRKNDRLHTENVDFHISEKYLDLKCKFWVHRPCVVWALSCSWQSLQALWAYLMEGKMTKISQVLKLQLFSMYTAIGSPITAWVHGIGTRRCQLEALGYVLSKTICPRNSNQCLVFASCSKDTGFWCSNFVHLIPQRLSVNLWDWWFWNGCRCFLGLNEISSCSLWRIITAGVLCSFWCSYRQRMDDLDEDDFHRTEKRLRLAEVWQWVDCPIFYSSSCLLSSILV